MSRNIHVSILAATACVLSAVSCNDEEPSFGATAGTSSGQAGSGGKSNGGAAGSSTSAGTSAGSSTAGSGGVAPTAGTAANAGSAGDTEAGGQGPNIAGQPGVGGADEGEQGGTGAAAGAGGAPADDGDKLSPLLKYGFDDGAGTLVDDSSPNGFDGTSADPGVWSPDGRTGGALSLNGGNPPIKYVSLPSGVLSGASNFTMASWVKMNASAPWSRILDFGNNGAGTDTRFVYLTPSSNQGIRFSIFGGAANREATVVTNTQLPLGVWKHVAVSAKDGENYVYVDGFPAGHASTIIVPISEMEPLAGTSWLGKSRFPDGGFDGLMDDFVVYDRALGANEIADLAWPKSDYSSWRFDEAAGTKAKDSSDRAIDASLEGGAVWTSGRQNAGVDLAGTSEHIAIAANPLGGCTTEMTLGVWVKLHAATQWSRVLDFGSGVESFMFLVPRDGSNALHFVMHTATEETNLVSNTTVPVDASWHHVAVVVSPSAATLFLDGISVANVPSPAISPSELGNMTENWLGRSRFGADPYLNASLDELRLSCRAFTEDEIKNLAFK